MNLYRVAAVDARAKSGHPGHPLAVSTRFQKAGRWDNPDLYSVIYLAMSPEGAVAEAFANIPRWSEDMFNAPFPPGHRSLVTLSVPSNLSLVDFDDAATLVARALRPTQIVVRNPGFTQALAARIFAEKTAAGEHQWHGLRWWSYHRAYWTNIALWTINDTFPSIEIAQVEQLTLGHPSVIEARKELSRPDS